MAFDNNTESARNIPTRTKINYNNNHWTKSNIGKLKTTAVLLTSHLGTFDSLDQVATIEVCVGWILLEAVITGAARIVARGFLKAGGANKMCIRCILEIVSAGTRNGMRLERRCTGQPL